MDKTFLKLLKLQKEFSYYYKVKDLLIDINENNIHLCTNYYLKLINDLNIKNEVYSKNAEYTVRAFEIEGVKIIALFKD